MEVMRKATSLWIAVLVFTLLFPPLYVASCGPAIWCRDRGIISQDTMLAVHWPVMALEKVPIVGRLVFRYLDLWYSQERQINLEAHKKAPALRNR
jgi:hypothetical protein